MRAVNGQAEFDTKAREAAARGRELRRESIRERNAKLIERQSLVDQIRVELDRLHSTYQSPTERAASLALISNLRRRRDGFDRRLSELRKVLAYTNQLTPPFLTRPATWSGMIAKTKTILTLLHEAEIQYGGEVGKEGGPPIYPVSPPVLGLGERLIWAAQHPLDATVTLVWKLLLVNLILGVLAIFSGHLSHRIVAAGQHGVTPISDGRRRVARVA
jgi:hypothetical protein